MVSSSNGIILPLTFSEVQYGKIVPPIVFDQLWSLVFSN